MLKHVVKDLDDEGPVYISYRLDGSLFNLRRPHAQKTALSSCPVTSSSLTTLPSLPTPRDHSTTKLPVSQRLPSPSDSRSAWRRLRSFTKPRRAPPLHHHRWKLAESNLSFNLSGVYHHIRRQDRQGSRTQTGQDKQRVWQTLQKTMKQQAPEERPLDLRLSSHRTHHPAVRLGIMCNLPSTSTSPWALPSARSPHHP